LAVASATVGPARDARADEAETADARKVARERYAEGVRLYRAGSFAAALTEFRAAYEASPSWRVLYNIAQVEAQLHDPAASMKTFERYLAEGGAQIDAARRAEVTSELARMATLVATLDVRSDTPGARVFVDDIDVGAPPLSLRVNVGPRTVRISAEGYVSSASRVLLSSGETNRVSVALDAAPAAPPVGPRDDASSVRDGPRPIPRGWITARWAFGIGTLTSATLALASGALALKTNGDLSDALANQPADPSRVKETRARLHAVSVTADVLLGVGVLSVAGLVVSLLGPFEAKSPRTPTASARPKGPAVRAMPTVGGAAMEIRF
jgi:hypothetical protein